MKVKLIFEGRECVLVVEPEDAQDKALLFTFGIKGPLEAVAIMNPTFAAGERNEILKVVVRANNFNQPVERVG